MWEVIGKVFVEFGTEIVVGGIVLGVRWIEKRWMNSKFRTRLKKDREVK